MAMNGETVVVTRGALAEVLREGFHPKGGLLSAQGLILFGGRSAEEKRKQILQEPAYGSLLAEMREEAERLLREPIAALPYSLFRLFETQGTRLEYERPYFSRRKRLTALALMSWLEPARSDYSDALAETIWAICDEFTWCLPAHMSGSAELNPDVAAVSSLYADAPTVQVDLFASETAFALCEIAWLLGDPGGQGEETGGQIEQPGGQGEETGQCGKTGQGLPPLLNKRIAEEVVRRVLRPFVKQRQRPFGWETARSNWASVCGGSIGAAAIYLLAREEQAEELADVIGLALPALASFLAGYEADGACTEGYGYWQYGFGYYVYFADLLRQRTGGALDLFAPAKVHAIARFQQASFLDGRQVVSFSDSASEAGVFMGLAHYLHAQYPDVAAPETKLRAAYAADHCGRWAPAARNLFWFRPEAEPGEPWPADTTYLGDAQWLVSRYAPPAVSAGAGGGAPRYAFAAKGGHNGEPHNHNDLGHFILFGAGHTFLVDLGSGMYTRDYFREGRYDILCNGSQGHSVPIVNGAFQKPGAGCRANVLDIAESDEADRFSLDLAGAYDSPSLRRLNRTFVWRKGGATQPELLLEDAFQFSSPPQSVVERFVTLTRPDLAEAGQGIVTLAAPVNAADDAELDATEEPVRLRIRFDAEAMGLRVAELEHIDHFGQPVACYALDFTLLQPSERSRASFAFAFE